MEEVRSIISYRIDEYGSVKVKLAEDIVIASSM